MAGSRPGLVSVAGQVAVAGRVAVADRVSVAGGSAEDLDAFFVEYSELLAKHGHGRHDAPPGARLMQLRMFYIPDEPAEAQP